MKKAWSCRTVRASIRYMRRLSGASCLMIGLSHSGNANANIAADEDGAQQQKRPTRWQRLWSSCSSCFSCFTCCSSVCTPSFYSNACLCSMHSTLSIGLQEPEQIEQRTHGFSVTKRSRKYLLPDLPPQDRHKKCLVLDLDETLVHSSFKVLTTMPNLLTSRVACANLCLWLFACQPVPNADFVLSIELEGEIHNV